MTRPRRRRSAAQRVGVRVGVDLDCAAALEADAQARDERAGDVERLRRGDDALRPLRVGRRVDLFGRDVRHVPHARARLRRAALLREARARQQADREVGAGAFEVERVEVERVEAARAPGRSARSARARPPPGRARRGGRRARRPARGARAPRRRRGPGRRPAPSARVGIGRERPRDRAVVDRLERLLDRRQAVEPGARRVDAVEQARRDERHEHARAPRRARRERASAGRATAAPSRASPRGASRRGSASRAPSKYCTSTYRAPFS